MRDLIRCITHHSISMDFLRFVVASFMFTMTSHITAKFGYFLSLSQCSQNALICAYFSI